MDRLGLESSSTELTAEQGKGGQVDLWEDIAKKQETALVLKDRDQIE